MPYLERAGLTFHYLSRGEGLPFLFQHGLGGDVNQPFGLYTPFAGIRLLSFDMRAHGQTRPVGDEALLSIATCADDLVALLDHLGVERAVIGGISLGAAVAANVAIHYPKRLLGLIFSRPAWIERPLPSNVALYGTIARLVRENGAAVGGERFRQSLEFEQVLRESPDCANSLLGQFADPRAEECVARLERIPADSPTRDRSVYGAIAVPTLVLGNRQDPIHPWSTAQELASLIPKARLRELTPKSISLSQHTADVQTAIDEFLRTLIPQIKGSPC
jgi:pimeloyl-ACP methyl ester carboxylesterase